MMLTIAAVYFLFNSFPLVQNDLVRVGEMT